MQGDILSKPNVWLVGDVEHGDFAEAVSLLRATATIGSGTPELIVFAQSRPGVIRTREVERLRRSAPLAGVVSLLGSWCEGESRTGRPVAGARRLYWYEFPVWWRRQLALLAAGSCPEWAGGEDFGLRHADVTRDWRLEGARIAVAGSNWDTVAAISDVLRSTRADSTWWRNEPKGVDELAVSAGIWAGGQLSDAETEDLASFCDSLARSAAPVVALLDFPRRDRCEIARRAGAAAVLGKPWFNADLVTALQQAVAQSNPAKARSISSAA